MINLEEQFSIEGYQGISFAANMPIVIKSWSKYVTIDIQTLI